MPKIIYYSRPIHRYHQNPRDTCRVSQRLSTLRAKFSKRRTYLNQHIQQPMWSPSGMSQDYKKVWHFYAQLDLQSIGSSLHILCIVCLWYHNDPIYDNELGLSGPWDFSALSPNPFFFILLETLLVFGWGFGLGLDNFFKLIEATGEVWSTYRLQLYDFDSNTLQSALIVL